MALKLINGEFKILSEEDEDLASVHSAVNKAYASLQPKIKCKFCDEKFKLFDDMTRHISTSKEASHVAGMKALRAAIKNRYAGITAPIREELDDLVKSVDSHGIREIVAASSENRGTEVQERFQELVCQRIKDAISFRVPEIVKEMFTEGKTWKDRKYTDNHKKSKRHKEDAED